MNIFLQNHAENEAGRLVLDHLVFFKKLYMSEKQVLCRLVVNVVSQIRLQ